MLFLVVCMNFLLFGEFISKALIIEFDVLKGGDDV